MPQHHKSLFGLKKRESASSNSSNSPSSPISATVRKSMFFIPMGALQGANSSMPATEAIKISTKYGYMTKIGEGLILQKKKLNFSC